MILSICSNPDILKVMRIIKIIINLIKIIVPIILIISLMIDYTRAVSDGKLEEAMKSLKNKAITAIVIFLIPTFVTIIFKIVDVNRDYYDCLENATSAGIQNAYKEQVETLIDSAKKNLSTSDYDLALRTIEKIKDEDTQKELKSKLSTLKSYIAINEEIDSYITTSDSTLLTKIQEEIDALDEGEYKEKLSKKLSTNIKQASITTGTYHQSAVSNQSAVDYGDYVLKQKYTNIYVGYFQNHSFWLYVPNNVKSMGSVPLILYLHGLGGGGNDYKTGSQTIFDEGLIKPTVTSDYAFNAIIAQVQLHDGEYWDSASYYPIIFNLTDALKKHYNINSKKISLVGLSNGCYGTKHIVIAHPKYFSCVVAVGCQYNTPSQYPEGTLLNSYLSTPLYAIGASDGNATMESFVKQLNARGGEGYYKNYGTEHGQLFQDGSSHLYRKKDLKIMEWILSKERK